MPRPEKNASGRLPVRGCAVGDTTGAGDTFVACFLYALSRGYDLRRCARFANAGASLCVERIGAAGDEIELEAILKRAGLSAEEPA